MKIKILEKDWVLVLGKRWWIVHGRTMKLSILTWSYWKQGGGSQSYTVVTISSLTLGCHAHNELSGRWPKWEPTISKMDEIYIPLNRLHHCSLAYINLRKKIIVLHDSKYIKSTSIVIMSTMRTYLQKPTTSQNEQQLLNSMTPTYWSDISQQ